MPGPSLQGQAGGGETPFIPRTIQTSQWMDYRKPVCKPGSGTQVDSIPKSKKQNLMKLGTRGARSQARENKAESGYVHLLAHLGRVLVTGSRAAAPGDSPEAGSQSPSPSHQD